MRITDDLVTIRPIWLTKVSTRLARGESLRESFSGELERFYHSLAQCIEMGDSAWLEPVVASWVHSGTQSEREHRELSLPVIIHMLLQAIHETACEVLPEANALRLTSAVMPHFLHASECAASQELQVYLNNAAADLQKANSALEQLDKTKSDFIAIAAHELKTPLTLIEGYTSMLRDLLPAEIVKESADAFLKGIDTGNRRLREIVDDMIDVSMIDNNLLKISFQPVWINRLLSVVEKEMSGVVHDRRLRLKIKRFDGSDEMTYGDGERLLQAFKNLVSNAIKYTPDGGTITVDGRMLPGFVEVVVTDTGIGIAPEDHVRIFAKFGRLGSVSLHSSGKTKFKGGGPGLGLPITKGIIEAHGGAIWVESSGYDEQECPGSTFHVLLPVRKSPPDDRAARLVQSVIEPMNGFNGTS